MPVYFVCPGDATVTSNSVQCSAVISTVDASVHQPLVSPEDLASLVQSALYGTALLLACWLIKKAIDI